MGELNDVQNFEENQTQTENVKCTGCGSNMVFHPDTQTLLCPHCGNKKEFGSNAISGEFDLREGLLLSPKWSNETVVFECDNCGAKVVLESGQSATECPFCATSHVRKSSELAGIKPHAVIPFAFGRDKALQFSKAWAKKRLYAPRSFKKNLSAQNIKGCYTPCFTFDSDTFSYYEGRIGQTRTRTVGSGKNRRTQTYVVWRNIRGTYQYRFDDVLITAGTKFDQNKLDSVSPFDTNNAKKYEENYLLGFMAYHYDCELQSCWAQAKSSIDKTLRRKILSQYSYDKVAYLNVSTMHSDLSYKYVMLPVYIGNYKFKNKLYNFFVNGSTGKVAGKTPKSVLKIIFTALFVGAIIAGVLLLMMNGG